MLRMIKMLTPEEIFKKNVGRSFANESCACGHSKAIHDELGCNKFERNGNFCKCEKEWLI